MVKDEKPSMPSRPITLFHQIPILKTQKFWEGLKKGHIYFTKCKKCGKTYYPPQNDCSNCLTSSMEWVKLTEELTLETFTQVTAKPKGFTEFEPYIIAIASTVEGIKIMGWLEGVNVSEVKVGMKLKANTKLIDDKYFTVVFTPSLSQN